MLDSWICTSKKSIIVLLDSERCGWEKANYTKEKGCERTIQNPTKMVFPQVKFSLRLKNQIIKNTVRRSHFLRISKGSVHDSLHLKRKDL